MYLPYQARFLLNESDSGDTKKWFGFVSGRRSWFSMSEVHRMTGRWVRSQKLKNSQNLRKKNFLINFLTEHPHILGIVRSGLMSRNRRCSYFWPEMCCLVEIREKLSEIFFIIVIRINMGRPILELYWKSSHSFVLGRFA